MRQPSAGLSRKVPFTRGGEFLAVQSPLSGVKVRISVSVPAKYTHPGFGFGLGCNDRKAQSPGSALLNSVLQIAAAP